MSLFKIMLKRARYYFKRLSVHRKRRKVEKALGLRLYDWQFDYIFDLDVDVIYSQERRSGKSLAQAIKICLSHGPEIALNTMSAINEIRSMLIFEDRQTKIQTEHFIRALRQCYQELENVKGLKIRKIKW